jgi:arylsulfatase A-like enzyme
MKPLTRRTLIKTSALLTGATVLGGPSVRARAAARRPNIVFIMADDLGYADVSCYGRRDYRTPAIDKLAGQGLRFLHAYANSAVCSATRTALMTGRYQNRLPVGLEEPLGQRAVGLPPEHPTLPSILRKAGYKTALIGKWHLGALPNYGPQQSGYDHFWGLRGGGLDYFTHKAFGRADLWDDGRAVTEEGYLTDLLGNKAIESLEGFSRQQQPFFLSLHFNAPHWPWEGPDDMAEALRLDKSGKPAAIFDYDGGSAKIFAAMVTRMDYQIGRVLRRLEELGMAKDTIVIFTSDNGGERFSDTWPFSGRKTELLEGGLRIPAIIRWPGVVAPGQSSDQTMITMDWLPTLLAAAGTSADPAYPPDGENLLPVLRNPRRIHERTLAWRYLNLNQEACRKGDWKYLKILDNRFLFNVVEDPLERANLKDRMPAKFAELVAAFRQWDAQMLPLDPKASTGGFSGSELADHFGIAQTRTVQSQ